MTEAQVSATIAKEFVKYGAVVWKVSDRFHSSRPDLVACYKGYFIAIETKICPNKSTKLQQYTLEKLAGAHGLVYVASYNKKTGSISFVDVSTYLVEEFTDIRSCVSWLSRQRC